MSHRACIVRVCLIGHSPLNGDPERFVTTVITSADSITKGAAEREAIRRARMLGLVAPFEIEEVFEVAKTFGPPSRPIGRGRGMPR